MNDREQWSKNRWRRASSVLEEWKAGRKERMDEAMDTALVQSSRDSSPKRSYTSITARMYVVFLFLSHTPPHKCVCVWRVRVCVWAREVWCRPLQWVDDALPTSTLPAFLPAELLQAECAEETLLSVLISPVHLLTLPLPFSSLARSARSLAVSPSPLPPPHILHHKLRVCVVLQPCNAACRVQLVEGVSCELA